MIEVNEIKPAEGEWLIAINKKTSIDYYTYAEARIIKKRLNELIPDE